ncbi:MAG: amidohydrolase family protein, partial [Promethearchaeota archaeon]
MSDELLIKNGMIVTGDKRNTIIPEGYIRVNDGKISEIREGEPSYLADTVIDASGCVIIPGLITAHTHLYGILLRGASLNIKPPTDFAQVLQRVWWPVDEALTVEDAYASALSAGADMLRNGSTLFADTYSGPNSIEGSLQAIAKATREIGIRGILAFEMTERNDSEEANRGLQEGIKFIESCEREDLVSGMVSIHASFTVGDEIVRQAVEQAKLLDVPITVHTSEGLVDLYHNLETSGERTVERLDRLGLLGPRTVLGHCVHVNQHEIDLISKRRASVAHNPMSNMLNAVGVAPITAMLEKGITVGLGNDGWIFDPFENMHCALTVHRLASGNPSAIGPDEIFKMATIEGARCYGLENEIGSLEKRKLADIVILDSS